MIFKDIQKNQAFQPGPSFCESKNVPSRVCANVGRRAYDGRLGCEATEEQLEF